MPPPPLLLVGIAAAVHVMGEQARQLRRLQCVLVVPALFRVSFRWGGRSGQRENLGMKEGFRGKSVRTVTTSWESKRRIAIMRLTSTAPNAMSHLMLVVEIGKKGRGSTHTCVT